MKEQLANIRAQALAAFEADVCTVESVIRVEG